ncbi:MAG: right-handed parallel beta-helix repeat-containing protein [archaeon]
MERRAYLAAVGGIFLAGCTTVDDGDRSREPEPPTTRRDGPESQRTRQTATTRPPPESLDAIVDRLSSASDGDTVSVPADVEIDLTDRWEIRVPSGVTLEGGRDEEQSVPGALLRSPAGDEAPEYDPNRRKILLDENARLTGFRLQGHFTDYVNPSTEHDGDYYAHRGGGGVTASHEAEVDNNEIAGWPYAGVVVHGDAHIHHNDIHHNTWEGLGYGVVVPGGTHVPLIEANYFNYNRHSITASGSSAGYEARHNVVGPDWVGAQFDVHGTEGMQGIAGDRIVIERNTFQATTSVAAKTRKPDAEFPAIHIRGTPIEGAWIERNWFYHDDRESAVKNPDSYEKIHFESNHYGQTEPTTDSIGAATNRSSSMQYPSGE